MTRGKPAPGKAPAASRPQRDSPARVLDVVDVKVSFGSVQALDRFSLSVRQGQFVGLIGPNGAGKTTCFNVISGFQRPSSGYVRFAGQRVTHRSAAVRARLGIARTFQNIGLDKAASVWDNLRVAHECAAAPLRSRRRLDVFQQLTPAGVLDLLQLHDVRRKSVRELPIGLAKRVELGTALLRRPRLLLLDEPASGLDGSERLQLKEMLLQLKEANVTSILMIEHDMELAMSVVDHVYVLNFGVPLVDGAPRDVQRDRRVIEAYLGPEK